MIVYTHTYQVWIIDLITYHLLAVCVWVFARSQLFFGYCLFCTFFIHMFEHFVRYGNVGSFSQYGLWTHLMSYCVIFLSGWEYSICIAGKLLNNHKGGKIHFSLRTRVVSTHYPWNEVQHFEFEKIHYRSGFHPRANDSKLLVVGNEENFKNEQNLFRLRCALLYSHLIQLLTY